MRRVLVLVVVAMAIAMLTVACGDDDDDSGGDDGGAATTAPAGGATTAAGGATTAAGGATTTAADGGGEQKAVDIDARSFEFVPAEFSFAVGDQVTFNYTNESGNPHTFSVYEDEEFTTLVGETPENSSDETGQVTITFDKAQDYYFRCEVHPTQMQGEIVVE